VSAWPDVPECYGHRDGSVCAQCDGSHDHQWIEGAPPYPSSTAIPVRCSVCGGRKCDWSACWERRHHRGPHVLIDGTFEKVGT
jgi:hypothetical protein